MSTLPEGGNRTSEQQREVLPNAGAWSGHHGVEHDGVSRAVGTDAKGFADQRGKGGLGEPDARGERRSGRPFGHAPRRRRQQGRSRPRTTETYRHRPQPGQPEDIPSGDTGLLHDRRLIPETRAQAGRSCPLPARLAGNRPTLPVWVVSRPPSALISRCYEVAAENVLD